MFHATSGNKTKKKTWQIRILPYHYVHEPYFSEKLFMQMPIEPHLVLKHISYINTPKNPIFKLVTRVNTCDFTVLKEIMTFYLAKTLAMFAIALHRGWKGIFESFSRMIF